MGVLDEIKAISAPANFNEVTRLESKVFSFKRLYPSFPVEFSKSQLNKWVRKNFGLEKIIDLKKNFGPQKIVGPKKMLEQNCGYKKLLALKKIGVGKKFVQKTFCCTKIITPKNWIPKVWSKSDQ